MRRTIRSVGLLLALAASVPAAAQPPASGQYESWSPILRRPVGPLASTPAVLPRWLAVVTTGDRSVVTFRPEGRVVWRVRWGPHGVTRKVTLVDGEVVHTTRFEYDARGHLTRKHVDGPALPGAPWTATYVTDPRGRVLERAEQLVRRAPGGSRDLPRGTAAARWIVSWGPRVVARQEVDGRVVRVDTFLPDGRLLDTELRGASASVGLRYHRVRDAVVRIDRRRPGARGPASAHARDSSVSTTDLQPFFETLVEQHEVRLVLGSPATATDEGRGRARRLTDDYSDGCWLNDPNGLQYDATGLLVGSVTQCICGFCVDAALPVEAEEVLAVDLHWTAGPWVRLDGRVDVTADHEVLTPDGPVPAGDLGPGDGVLRTDGSLWVLGAVELLPDAQPRLGRNVRTRSGTFGAGGLLVRSEAPRPCP